MELKKINKETKKKNTSQPAKSTFQVMRQG